MVLINIVGDCFFELCLFVRAIIEVAAVMSTAKQLEYPLKEVDDEKWYRCTLQR